MAIQNITASLFEDSPSVPGMMYMADFIDAELEECLIHSIDEQPWISDLKRRVQHYGYRYDYKARSVTPDLKLGDIPIWLMPYCQRLKNQGLFQQIPDQVIINEYQPGQGIAAHIDCIPCFGDTIASLSLASSCVMHFKHEKTQQKSEQFLEPRSLLVLSKTARYEWQHGIAHRKTDKIGGCVFPRQRRLSLTFRNVKI